MKEQERVNAVDALWKGFASEIVRLLQSPKALFSVYQPIQNNPHMGPRVRGSYTCYCFNTHTHTIIPMTAVL